MPSHWAAYDWTPDLKKINNATYNSGNEGLPSTEQIPVPLENVDETLLNLQTEVSKHWNKYAICFTTY